MHRLPRRIAVAVISLSLLAVAAPANAAVSDADRADRAVGYIASQQNPNGSIPAFSPIGSTADAVLALVAARSGRPEMRSALRYLARQTDRGNVTGIGLQAKVALAFAAAGRSPRDVGGVNLVAELRSGLRTDAPPLVYDSALGVLALEAVGATAPDRAITFLVRNQCPDGGWPYDRFRRTTENEHCFSGDAGTDFYLSDTNSTANALMALRAAGTAPRRNAFRFLREIRDTGRGGWGYTWGFQATDANSTGLVLQAYASADRKLPGKALRALRSLQYVRCGAFAYTFDGGKTAPDVGATIGAVPGLLGVALPYSRNVTAAATSTPSCPS